MIDLLFYHNAELHLHFNLLKPKPFNTFSINDQGQSLCYLNNITFGDKTIFGDVSKMTADDKAQGGNQQITIQKLSNFFPDYDIVDIGGQPEEMPFKIPGRVRSGDINIDGYPDVYITLQLRKKGEPNSKIIVKSFILINIECSNSLCINQIPPIVFSEQKAFRNNTTT